MTLERRLRPGEQQYRVPSILHHLQDHPELQQVQELREEETLPVLMIADGNFSPTEVIRGDKKLTLHIHRDRVRQEEQPDNRLVKLTQQI